jgi:hypothetical protein
MKTPEQALTEWTSGEIKFDFGRGTRTFSRENFTYLCDRVRSNSTLEHSIQITCTNGELWDVSFKSFVDEPSFHEAFSQIEKYYKKDKFVAQLAVQFQSLDEVCRWARGDLDGKLSVQVQNIPPVDSWLRPTHR